MGCPTFDEPIENTERPASPRENHTVYNSYEMNFYYNYDSPNSERHYAAETLTSKNGIKLNCAVPHLLNMVNCTVKCREICKIVRRMECNCAKLVRIGKSPKILP
jgi:hypothetical protein